MSRHTNRLRGSRSFVLSAVLFGVALPAPTGGQTAVSEAALREEERVTVVDVLVELDAAKAKDPGKRVSLPRGLAPDDFSVEIDGERLPVVSFRDPRATASDASPATAAPWRIVLYFDLELARRDTVRWAAAGLADWAPRLVELGEVELVVAGDGERRGLAPTRDPELLASELAGLAIKPSGVHRQIELRAEVLDALGEDPEAFDETGVAEALVGQEVGLVEARLDDLLLHLVDRDQPGIRRALFWVADGFDLAPETFYESQGFAVGRMPMALRERIAKLSVTMAGYGWVGVALSPPVADAGLVPGFRIGKWLFSRGTVEGLVRGEVIFARLTREERRDPEKARAHHAIGVAHLAAGEPEDAEQEFERALYHYAGDPRTAQEQAVAKAGLGRALEAQGAHAEARQAFRHAVELDPQLDGELPQSRPRLLEPLAFQESLALATSGRLVESEEDLAEAIESLSRRGLLTYQVSGVAQGEVRKLKVSLAGSDLDLSYPGWTRSGSPSGVAAARARRLATGEYDDGELEVRARLSGERGVDRTVLVEVDPTSLVQVSGREARVLLRITTATGAPDGIQDVRYQRFEVEPETIDSPWRFGMSVEEVPYEGWASVIVEDLVTGRWGADLAE